MEYHISEYIGDRPNFFIDDTKLPGSQSSAFVRELVAEKDAASTIFIRLIRT